MKVFFISLFLFSLASSYAQDCYELDSKNQKISGFPKTICVYDIKTQLMTNNASDKSARYKVTLDTDLGVLVDEATIGQSGELEVTNLIKRDSSYACSEEKKNFVAFNFQFDSSAKVMMDSLELRGIYEYNEDPCHFDSKVFVVKYNRL